MQQMTPPVLGKGASSGWGIFTTVEFSVLLNVR